MAKRRNQRQRRKRSKGKTPGKSTTSRGGDQDPVVLQLTETTISWEPLEDPALDRLPESVRAEMDSLHAGILGAKPESLLEKLERYHAKFPFLPVFGNWLGIVYDRLGREKDRLHILRELHRRHPDYVFARVDLAKEAMEEDDLERAEELLGSFLYLPSLLPHRKVFHITEVMSHSHAAGQFALLSGDIDRAKSIYEMMRDLEPRHPATLDLKRMLKPKARQGFEMLAALRQLRNEAETWSERQPKSSRRRPKKEDRQLELPL